MAPGLPPDLEALKKLTLGVLIASRRGGREGGRKPVNISLRHLPLVSMGRCNRWTLNDPWVGGETVTYEVFEGVPIMGMSLSYGLT